MHKIKSKTLAGLFGVAALVAASAPLVASAGMKAGSSVYMTTGRFEGAMGNVRNSSNTQEYIGCSLSSGIARCEAQNASGTYATCVTTNANHIASIQSLTANSFVQVYYNTAGTCTTVFTGVWSYFATPSQ